jgi:hypothetical protein
MKSIFWEMVLIALNCKPDEYYSGFFVGRVDLQKWTLLARRKLERVVRTFHNYVCRCEEDALPDEATSNLEGDCFEQSALSQ